jgi:hypothetical protein
VLGLANCKKSSEEPLKPSERELLLTTPKWRLDSFAEEETTAAGVVTLTPIPLTTFDPCSLDDFGYYRVDKSFAVDEGAVKCSATNPGLIVSGTWAFVANETELLVTSDKSVSYSRRIRTLTATTMTLASSALTLSNGTTSVQLRT